MGEFVELFEKMSEKRSNKKIDGRMRGYFMGKSSNDSHTNGSAIAWTTMMKAELAKESESKTTSRRAKI